MKIGTDALKGIPAVGVLTGLALLGVGAAVYWSNFEARRHYLQQRNFRQMATLARQAERMLNTQARLVSAKLKSARVEPGASAVSQIEALEAKVRKQAVHVTWALPAERRSSDVLRSTLADPDNYRLGADRQHIEIAWGSPTDELKVQLSAAAIVGPALEGRLSERTFDTLALVTPSGRVVMASGARSEALRAMLLDNLVAPTPDATDGAFAKVARTIGARPVRLAEGDYVLFVQPCCKGGGAGAEVAPALVLIGLADANALQAASMAISPLLVFGAVVLVLAALVSWAFLKVSLTHAHQAVSQLDVLQLGTSSVFGVALATLIILGTGAYLRMRADIDGQLRVLGQRIATSMSQEIEAAYSQSLRVRAVLEPLCLAASGSPSAAGSPSSGCVRTKQELLADATATPGIGEPEFASVALIDATGRQAWKAYTELASADQIDVADRAYFHAVVNRKAWSMKECRGDLGSEATAGCVIESVFSWGTGVAQAVLAYRSEVPGLPVAAIAFPMRSVINPLLPVGFEFAVVDAGGGVLFHSDANRIGEENLVLETDRNPRIRALMAAHGADEVSTSYQGRDYRAHVRPAPIPGASIVTLFDKQHTRAIALEWMAAGLFLLSGYVAAWTIVMIGVVWSGTAWIWPDPFRRVRYRLLSGLYAVLFAGFIAVWLWSDSSWTLTSGLAAPVVAWIAAVLVLARRPAGVRGKQAWSSLGLDYRLMSALLLAVTAVVPGIAFANFSFGMHVESFVKHREIALARAAGRTPATTGAIGHYGDVFYDSVVSVEREPAAPARTGRVVDELVQLLLEDVLPYYTATSVEMRELLHETSQDETWRSRARPDGTLALSVDGGLGSPRIAVTATMPSLVAVRALADQREVVPWTVLVLLCLLPLAAFIWWVAGFMQHRIFLTDVVDRVWIKGRLVTTAGQHLLVVCRDPAVVALKFEQAERAWLSHLARPRGPLPSQDLAALAARALPTMALVISDLDGDKQEPPSFGQRLAVLQWLMAESHWTIVLVSRQPRASLEARIAGLHVDDARRTAWHRLISSLDAVTLPAEVEDADEGLAITIGAPMDDSGDAPAGLRRLLRRLVRRLRGPGWAPQSPQSRQALLVNEGRPSQALRTVCRGIAESDDVRSGFLTAAQILDEVDEHARPIYQAAWTKATEDERVVLEHVARFGLTNAASGPIVRKLLARGLLRKDPELRLMNRTFRRFVLGADCRREVARLEGQAEPSLWDRLRAPLAVGATIAVVFLVTTQREMFDATLTVAAGMTTAVPTLIRLTTMLAQWGPSAVKDIRT